MSTVRPTTPPYGGLTPPSRENAWAGGRPCPAPTACAGPSTGSPANWTPGRRAESSAPEVAPQARTPADALDVRWRTTRFVCRSGRHRRHGGPDVIGRLGFGRGRRGGCSVMLARRRSLTDGGAPRTG